MKCAGHWVKSDAPWQLEILRKYGSKTHAAHLIGTWPDSKLVRLTKAKQARRVCWVASGFWSLSAVRVMYVMEAPADASVLLVRASMFSCVGVEAGDEVWTRQTMLLSSPLPAANLVTLSLIR